MLSVHSVMYILLAFVLIGDSGLPANDLYFKAFSEWDNEDSIAIPPNEMISIGKKLLSNPNKFQKDELGSIYEKMGDIYLRTENNLEGYEAIMNAKKYLPDSPEFNCKYLISLFCIGKGNEERFGELISNAMKASKKDWRPYKNIGHIYSDSKNPKKSNVAFTFALSLGKNPDPIIYNFRGLNYYKLQEFDKAYNDFRKCYELLPLHVEATINYYFPAALILGENLKKPSMANSHYAFSKTLNPDLKENLFLPRYMINLEGPCNNQILYYLEKKLFPSNIPSNKIDTHFKIYFLALRYSEAEKIALNGIKHESYNPSYFCFLSDIEFVN